MKGLIYYPMLFVRPILKIVVKLLSGLLFIGSLIAFFSKHSDVGAVYLGLAFALFLLGQVYDRILLIFAPEGTVLFD